MTVAILGATGMVGRTMLSILEQRAFPLDDLRLLASERSADRVVRFRGRELAVQAVSEHAFDGVSIALFATSAELSRQWAPVAQAAGACVVDNSSAFRMEPHVPLVVPEVNGALLDRRPTLVANGNCVAIPLVMTRTPGALRHAARAASTSTGRAKVATTEAECPMRTGTRTEVGVTASAGRSSMRRVSFTILRSSPVQPSSSKRSMCASTLYANGGRPSARGGGEASSPARTPRSSSSIASAPAPDTL